MPAESKIMETWNPGLKYFGYKLISYTTSDVSPNIYVLVPANLYERLSTKAVFDNIFACDLLADKDFIGGEWQTRSFTRLII